MERRIFSNPPQKQQPSDCTRPELCVGWQFPAPGFICGGDDGIQRKNQTAGKHSGGDVMNYMIHHDEGSDGHIQLLCKDDGHDRHAVNGTAVADRQTASDSGNQNAETCTELQNGTGKRRGDADVYGQYICNQPGTRGIDGDCIHGVYRKRNALFFRPNRKRGMLRIGRENERDIYSGAIWDSSMEVSEIPPS